jgi:hypothetical protein
MEWRTSIKIAEPLALPHLPFNFVFEILHYQAEISFSVGPVPVDDNIGKEVVTRWTSSVSNGDSAPTISTDSNGREFLERIYDYRPTWNLSNAEPVRTTDYVGRGRASRGRAQDTHCEALYD